MRWLITLRWNYLIYTCIWLWRDCKLIANLQAEYIIKIYRIIMISNIPVNNKKNIKSIFCTYLFDSLFNFQFYGECRQSISSTPKFSRIKTKHKIIIICKFYWNPLQIKITALWQAHFLSDESLSQGLSRYFLEIFFSSHDQDVLKFPFHFYTASYFSSVSGIYTSTKNNESTCIYNGQRRINLCSFFLHWLFK